MEETEREIKEVIGEKRRASGNERRMKSVRIKKHREKGEINRIGERNGKEKRMRIGE